MKNNSKTNRRIKDIKSYIDNLQQEYSKLLVIRVDLHYKDSVKEDASVDRLKKDTQKLIKSRVNKSSPLNDSVGYVVKYEETPDRGPHSHMLAFFNGQKRKNDRMIAEDIGGHWAGHITDGEGTYYNPHRNKQQYDKQAIGLMSYEDEEKRQTLDSRVVRYLMKDEQVIAEGAEKSRSYVRGQLKPGKVVKCGRPRKYATLDHQENPAEPING